MAQLLRDRSRAAGQRLISILHVHRFSRSLPERRRRWLVVLAWLVIAGVAGPLAGRLGSVQDDDAATFLPADAESTRVAQIQREVQQAPVETVAAVVVYERATEVTLADEHRIAGDIRRIVKLPSVYREGVSPPIRAGDRRAVQIVVPVRTSPFETADEVEKIRDIARGGGGLNAYVTGPAGVAADQKQAFAGVDARLLLLTALVVVVILLLTYRSPFLWLIPLVSAMVALQTARAVNYLLARHADLTVTGDSSGVLTVLVFGVATDYALLLVARYREELTRHPGRPEAMTVALRGVGPAIVASAATVAVSLMCLLAADLRSSHDLGPVLAVGVVCAVLVMMTLLPALLVLAPRSVFWPRVPRYDEAASGRDDPGATGTWARISDRIGRRPRAVWVGVTVALVIMAAGLIRLDAGGLSVYAQFRGEPGAVAGQQAVERHFAGGSGEPAVVVGAARFATPLAATVWTTPGVKSVSAPQVRGDDAMIIATLKAEPGSEEAFRTVEAIRTRVHAMDGANALVGGDDAVSLDVREAAQRDRTVIFPLVLAVILVLLVFLLRALVAPVLLVWTVVVSFTAALGMSALVFEYVFHFEAADSSLPLYAFIFLVALGVDYNIFLMTRVREEVVRLGHRRAVLTGLAVTGGVITSAGVVLAATFLMLGLLPLVPLVQVGFTVAFGVLLDTLVVRSLLVPALAVDAGRSLWWPGRLSRPSPPRHARARHADPVLGAPTHAVLRMFSAYDAGAAAGAAGAPRPDGDGVRGKEPAEPSAG